MKLTKFEMTLTEEGLKTREMSFSTDVSKNRLGKYLHCHAELREMRKCSHDCVFSEQEILSKLREPHYYVHSASPPAVIMYCFEGEHDIKSVEPLLLKALRALMYARREGLIVRRDEAQQCLDGLDALDIKLKELKGEGAWT